MFDIGFSEIMLVFVIGLIVLGPERLLGVVRTAAKWIGTVRSLSASVQQQISEELRVEELKKDLNAGLAGAGKMQAGVTAELKEAGSAISEAGKSPQSSSPATAQHNESPLKNNN